MGLALLMDTKMLYKATVVDLEEVELKARLKH